MLQFGTILHQGRFARMTEKIPILLLYPGSINIEQEPCSHLSCKTKILHHFGPFSKQPTILSHNISPEPPNIILCNVYKNCHWRTAGVEAGQSIYGSWVSKRILILRDRIPNSLTLPRIHKYRTIVGQFLMPQYTQNCTSFIPAHVLQRLCFAYKDIYYLIQALAPQQI